MAGHADSAVQWAMAQIGRTGWKNGASFVRDAYAHVGLTIPSTAIGQGLRLAEADPAHVADGDIILPTARLAQLYVGGDRVIGVTRTHRVAIGSVSRIWRVVRVTTPGGGYGLTLAVPGYTPPKTTA